MYRFCMPRAKNFDPNEVVKTHPDWMLTPCPICGQACYASKEQKTKVTMFPKKYKLSCTECAMRSANKAWKEAREDEEEIVIPDPKEVNRILCTIGLAVAGVVGIVGVTALFASRRKNHG